MINHRRVYIPVLVSDFEVIVEGEEKPSIEDAEMFGVAMAEEYMEETGNSCSIEIKTVILFY